MESTLLLHYNSVDNSPNVRIVVSDILGSSLEGRSASKSGDPPNKLTSTSPEQRLMAVIEWPHLGLLLGSVT